MEIVDRHIALADVAELGLVLEGQFFEAWYGLLHGRRSQLTESGNVGAARNLVNPNLHIADRHTPLLGGRLRQHVPDGGSNLPHALEMMTDGPRTVGVLIAILRLIAFRLRHGYPRPVGTHFIGHYHRQGRPRALPHLRAMGNDFDTAVGIERYKDERIVTQSVGHVFAADGIAFEGLGRSDEGGNRERCGGAGNEAAARHLRDADVPSFILRCRRGCNSGLLQITQHGSAPRGRETDGSDDALVATAAADIALHFGEDLLIRRVRFGGQQAGACMICPA